MLYAIIEFDKTLRFNDISLNLNSSFFYTVLTMDCIIKENKSGYFQNHCMIAGRTVEMRSWFDLILSLSAQVGMKSNS